MNKEEIKDVPIEEKTKYLGYMINSNLKNNEHIEKLKLKIEKL